MDFKSDRSDFSNLIVLKGIPGEFVQIMFKSFSSFAQASDICFDISGHNGTVFNLLHEPMTGLIINGEITDTVYKSHRAHRLAKIGVISPEGGMVTFNTTNIETFDNNGVRKIYNYDVNSVANGYISVEDVEISINSREKFRPGMQ